MGPYIFHASSRSPANEQRNTDSSEATSGGNRVITVDRTGSRKDQRENGTVAR